MKTKKVKLLHGYVIVPQDINELDISETGKANHAAIISDRAGELPPLLVLSDSSFCGINAETENIVVFKAIKNSESYLKIKDQELPYPDEHADDKAWIAWNDSFRLGLFPLEMFAHIEIDDYKLCLDDEE